MFKHLRQYRTIRELQKENKQLKENLIAKDNIIRTMVSEISRRDQKIIEQQKRLRFFGIEIGNEEYEAEKLDFPSTIKI